MKRSTYLLISEIMFFLAAVYALNFAENNLLMFLLGITASTINIVRKEQIKKGL